MAAPPGQQRRAPTPTTPYGQMLRRMQGRVRRMQDELSLETTTNFEFEQASRRSFEYLNGQVNVIKDAFNKLADGILEELDLMNSKVEQRIDGALRQHRQSADAELRAEIAELSRRQLAGEAAVAAVARDVDALLVALPKLEDRVDAVQQETVRLQSTTASATVAAERCEAEQRRQAGSAERFGLQLRRLETELRNDLEQLAAKLQRNLARSAEGAAARQAASAAELRPSSPARRASEVDLLTASPPREKLSSAAAPSSAPDVSCGLATRGRVPESSAELGGNAARQGSLWSLRLS